MPQGQPGADSSVPVTPDLIQQATTLFGAQPVFWGRYFTSTNTTGTVEYRHATENSVLNASGIRLLPIARQTNRVGLSIDEGHADGVANAKDFISTFGLSMLVPQGGIFYMFLDVERVPSLSTAYYTGWVQGLADESADISQGSVQILPCIYCGQASATSWRALQAATASGVPCKGIWIARYYSGSCQRADWNDAIVTPKQPSPFPWPIFAWQYAEECLNGAIDASQTNPSLDIQNQLLPYLVLPSV
jgi:hypothetical protein